MEVEEIICSINTLSLDSNDTAMEEEQDSSDEKYFSELKLFYEQCKKHNSKTNPKTVEGMNNIMFSELEALYRVYCSRYIDISIEEFKSRLCFSQGYNWINGKQHYYWYVSMLDMNDIAAQIPDNIGSLSRLSDLIYSWNELTSVPSTVWKLSLLQHLDLSHNELEIIPTAVDGLTNLRSLYLNHNKIKEVPNTLYNLQLLRYVDLSYNPLRNMPPGIEKMKSLTTLRLHHTYMRQYPKGAEQKIGLVMEQLYSDYTTKCISYRMP